MMANSLFGSLYGNLYHSFEIPGTKIYFHREVHHGLVLVSEDRNPARPARLELTQDSLAVQVPQALGEYDNADLDAALRTVTIRKDKDGGLGLSIKGGTDGSCKVPILISKIFKDQAADSSGQLFVGDAIIEVNGLSVENCTHDEVVRMLRDSGHDIQLVVRHNKSMAPFLRGGSLQRNQMANGSIGSIGRGSMHSRSATLKSDKSAASDASTRQVPKGWDVLVKIPLPMAYITRYLWGTDKLRPKGFEVRAVDGTSSGIVQCEDAKVADDWVRFISTNILTLNSKTIKMSNKYLPPNELIVYIGWISERIERPTTAHEFWQHWVPKFLILRGSDVCFFDSPPLNSADLTKTCYAYKVTDTSCRIVKEIDRLDDRKHCALVESCCGQKHYLSLESQDALKQLEGAWHRCLYYAVQREQARTFACNYEGRPSALTLDFNNGFALYDIPTKAFLWRRKFSELKGSADDGKLRLQLIFEGHNGSSQDMKDIECMQVYSLVFCIHAFMIARLVSTDPDFLLSTNG